MDFFFIRKPFKLTLLGFTIIVLSFNEVRNEEISSGKVDKLYDETLNGESQRQTFRELQATTTSTITNSRISNAFNYEYSPESEIADANETREIGFIGCLNPPLSDLKLQPDLSSVHSVKIPKRIVLVYSMTGESSSMDANFVTQRRMQQGIPIAKFRLQILDQMTRRLRELLERKAKKETLSDAPTNTARKLQPFKDIPVVLQSYYLDALEMEIVTELPMGVTFNEFQTIARSNPCIEDVHEDTDKYGFSGTKTIEPRSINSNTMNFNISTSRTTPIKPLPWRDRKNSGKHDNYLRAYSAAQTNRISWNLDDDHPFSIKAGIGWKLTTARSDPVTVAVIDSGCDIHHPALKNSLWVNPGEICDDGIDNDGNGYIDDCHGWDFVNDQPDPSPSKNGHGTGAAGIITTKFSDSPLGISVCPNCKIMCLKFIDGSHGTVIDQARAINYAIKMKVKISNNSYGGYSWSTLEYKMIQRAGLQNLLFVTSAGNRGAHTDDRMNFHTPSGYDLDNIISVGASTDSGSRASFSNYGKKSVHVFAPGNNVIVLTPGSGYTLGSGTSYAAPHISGVIGVLWSHFRHLEVGQIKKAIISGCESNHLLHEYATCSGQINMRNVLYWAFNEDIKARTQLGLKSDYQVPTSLEFNLV